MLQFIYGRAATGKTYTVFERIKDDVQKGKDVVLLVPEQFTFESERTLLHTLGDRSSTDVSVLSFTRLYDEVCRKVGGRVADVVTDFDRVLLIYRAINSESHFCKHLKYRALFRSCQRLSTKVCSFRRKEQGHLPQGRQLRLLQIWVCSNLKWVFPLLDLL